jgi:hypothetical protein
MEIILIKQTPFSLEWAQHSSYKDVSTPQVVEGHQVIITISASALQTTSGL